MTHLLPALSLLLQASVPPAVRQAPVLPDDTKPAYRSLSAPQCVHWRGARAGSVEESELRFGIYRLWVQGYVTGFNVVGPDRTGDLLGGGPQDELFDAIDGYCDRNRSSSVEDAMRPIATAYLRRRSDGASSGEPSGPKRKAQVLATRVCRDWEEGRGNAILRLAYASAISGYVTSYNRWGPDPVGDAVPDDRTLIEGWLDAWCALNPRGLLIGAVQPLIDHVARERAAGRLPPGGKRVQDR